MFSPLSTVNNKRGEKIKENCEKADICAYKFLSIKTITRKKNFNSNSKAQNLINFTYMYIYTYVSL